MTAQTTASGWLLVIGVGIFVLGALIVAYVRSERAEKRELARENFELRKVNAALTRHPAVSAFDTHWSSAIRDHAEPFRERLASVAPVIPLQRDGRWS